MHLQNVVILEVKGPQIFWEWQRDVVQVVISEVEMMEIIHIFKCFLLYSFPSKSVVANINKCQRSWQFWELPYFVVTEDKLSELRQLSECIFINLRY